MRHKNLHIAVALIILAVFTFDFLHSELDLITSEYDINHASHDFCHLVDNTTTFKEHSGSQTLKKFIADTPFTVVLTAVLIPVVSFVRVSPVQADPPGNPADKPCYILNRTILI
ncbi:MAG: hypothetical protein HF314_16445 [Ignavibacteria bacterium]|jgi:hypothetical protein|nr:hypothetical protein [Ignavibacteria bacterium]MCU7504673.1 hypothetical protein [Ignavibacteria bacterium]MCU7517519.1 hypothetical protein [Ignavibacteria bacterium]